MEILLILLILSLSWFGAGWVIITFQGIISNESSKKIINIIDSFATNSEKISPYLALIVFFGPIGILLKKELYGTDSKINNDL